MNITEVIVEGLPFCQCRNSQCKWQSSKNCNIPRYLMAEPVPAVNIDQLENLTFDEIRNLTEAEVQLARSILSFVPDPLNRYTNWHEWDNPSPFYVLWGNPELTPIWPHILIVEIAANDNDIEDLMDISDTQWLGCDTREDCDNLYNRLSEVLTALLQNENLNRVH